MKSKATVSELFELAKNAAPVMQKGEIESLTASGRTSPLAARAAFKPRRILRMFNPTKFLIMTTFIVIITTIVLTLNPSGSETKDMRHETADGRQETERLEDGKTVRLEDGKTGRPAGAAERLEKAGPKEEGAAQVGTVVPVIAPAKNVAAAQKDTVFEGEILKLSKEELMRLGFTFDEEGFYYLNRMPDGTLMNFWSWQTKPNIQVDRLSAKHMSVYASQSGGSFGFASGDFVNKHNKSVLHENDFYPVVTTNLYGEDIYPIDQIKNLAYTEFELMNDTLVPIRFSFMQLGGYQTEDKLVWFKVSDKFFDLMKSEQAERSRTVYNRSKELKIGQLTANRVDYNFLAALPLNNAIRLKPEVLKCMGINYAADAINVNIRAIEYWFNIQLSIVNGGTSMTMGATRVNPIQAPSDTLLPTSESIILLGISNFGNMKMVDMPTRVYRQLNRRNLSFHQYLNLCIPVIIEGSGITENLNEVIFWIYPNERFFNCLPPEIAVPMKKEFDFQSFAPMFIVEDMPNFRTSPVSKKGINQDSVPANPEPVPCVYFTNLCESLPGVDYVNLYPNPATDKLNVDLVLQSAKKIRFRVLDLGGRVITDDGAPEDFTEGGKVKHQLDVSRLQNGLYLLLMTDEEGARLTRRFVKN
jgi:hypothetical protein